MSYSVTIKGFKTKREVKFFYDWFEGAGEQDLSMSWEMEFGKYGPTTDMKIKPQWNNDNYEFNIKET